ncbi:MAG: (deoxy)nucleoside triphosphate pyrophosphohydrolase [Clostridiales bacterium]|nr:(deoxy)nucleoside triphosphate pyrophosphohydrolase [Clostridiales bacterium]
MVEVVAALIRQNDKFLICQRPPHKARALLWEFPGGKVEPGESFRQALIRECIEELAVTLEVGDLYMQVRHKYPDIDIRLSLFEAVISNGELLPKEHHAVAWIRSGELSEYAFCPADIEIVRKLSAEVY